MLKNFLAVVQIMSYYLLESLLIGIVFFVVWLTVILKFVDVNLTYLNCVMIIWLFKLLKFDIFNFIRNYQYDEKESID